jgi:hypothetical protein
MRNREFVKRGSSWLAVQKTYKLFIGGKFVRGENGRVLPARNRNGLTLANFCHASRKDFCDAVTAARNAFPNWSKRSVRRGLNPTEWRKTMPKIRVGSSTPWK